MTTNTKPERSTSTRQRTDSGMSSPDGTNATAHTATLPDCETLLVDALLDGEYPAEVLENNVYADLFRDPANYAVVNPGPAADVTT